MFYYILGRKTFKFKKNKKVYLLNLKTDGNRFQSLSELEEESICTLIVLDHIKKVEHIKMNKIK